MNLLITGYFGMNNLGDDIMLDVFCNELLSRESDIRLTVAILYGDANKIHLSDSIKILDLSWICYGKTIVFKYLLSNLFDAFFWIGGTCFTEYAGDGSYNYMKAFTDKGKKTGYLGVGIGDIKTSDKKERYKEIFDKASLVTFRDIESYKQAKKWSSNPEMYFCEDLVYLKDYRGKRDNTRNVVVSWRDLGAYCDRVTEDKALQEIINFLKEYCKDNSTVEVLVIGSKIDINRNKDLYDALLRSIPEVKVSYFENLSIQDKIEHLSNSKLSIIGRLHGIFISELMGINTIAIGYDNKSERFLKSIDREEDLVYPEQITQEVLKKMSANKYINTVDLTEKRVAAMENINLFIEKIIRVGD